MSKREIQIRLMMVEGLLSIQSGVSTIAINQKLSVFLTPAERAKMNDKEGGSSEQKD
ncbi:flagellar motor protein MotA [compost metagenome]